LAVVGMAVGGLPERWVVGHPLAGTLSQKIGSASAWAWFIIIVFKQRRERRSRHLAVIGMVVGSLPERWVVACPLAGTLSQKIGSASAWARFIIIFCKSRRERRS
jgi:hypothetical protein